MYGYRILSFLYSFSKVFHSRPFVSQKVRTVGSKTSTFQIDTTLFHTRKATVNYKYRKKPGSKIKTKLFISSYLNGLKRSFEQHTTKNMLSSMTLLKNYFSSISSKRFLPSFVHGVYSRRLPSHASHHGRKRSVGILQQLGGGAVLQNLKISIHFL